MRTTDAMQVMIDASGSSKRYISERMGKHPNFVASIQAQSAKKGGGVNSGTLANLADVCGYSLALVPHDSMPHDAIKIDPPDRGDGDV